MKTTNKTPVEAPEDLYTAADVKRVREQLIKEQDCLCGLTGVPALLSDYHLDHAHDSEQLVRAALHKQANMCLGKIENLATRYLYWYPHGLPSFLRCCADYLERPHDKRWRHPGWIKKAMVMFNKLSEPQKKKVLLDLRVTTVASNAAERKKLFQQVLLSKQYGYNAIRDIILKQT